MWVDILIVIFGISAIYRGKEIGFVRQLCSTIGFFGGLFLGAWLERYIQSHVNNPDKNEVIVYSLVITLGCALLGLTIGEYVGFKLKHKVLLKKANSYDNAFGSVLAAITLVLTAWLIAAILVTLPMPAVQKSINSSRIIRQLNSLLPDAPSIIQGFGKLINPNGFPQVFVGQEPPPSGKVDLPADLGDLEKAVQSSRASVVRIEGQGCGGIVEGSGFVVGSDLVATNAHVIAGIKKPIVQDTRGNHNVQVIWFDPDLDFAVLRVANLAGKSLIFSNQQISAGTPAVVMGYPGGGGLTAKTAAVLNQFTARGKNIYGTDVTKRDVFEIQADIIPGNSGGPLIIKDGSVIGMVFAESTTYEDIGYALTANQISAELKQAIAQNKTIDTGVCAEQ